MRYKLEGSVMPAVEMLLNRGESIYTQTGGMCWMSEGISMSTNARGGLMRGLGRMFSGESFFMTSYQAEMDGAMVAFGNKVEKELLPGEVIKVDTGNVVGFESSVQYEIEMVKGGMNIFLGGEGLFLTRLTGPGKIILQTQNFGEFCGRIRQYIPSHD